MDDALPMFLQTAWSYVVQDIDRTAYGLLDLSLLPGLRSEMWAASSCRTSLCHCPRFHIVRMHLRPWQVRIRRAQALQLLGETLSIQPEALQVRSSRQKRPVRKPQVKSQARPNQVKPEVSVVSVPEEGLVATREGADGTAKAVLQEAGRVGKVGRCENGRLCLGPCAMNLASLEPGNVRLRMMSGRSRGPPSISRCALEWQAGGCHSRLARGSFCLRLGPGRAAKPRFRFTVW